MIIFVQFQFLLGTIGSKFLADAEDSSCYFNSFLVRLGEEDFEAISKYYDSFQFLLGTIGRFTGSGDTGALVYFNSF